jgi:alpha-glucuronidase
MEHARTASQATDRPRDEDGYRLWLRYAPVSNPQRLLEYRDAISQVVMEAGSATLQVAQQELSLGLASLLGAQICCAEKVSQDGALVVGTPQSSAAVASLGLREAHTQAGEEGFAILRSRLRERDCTVVAANSDVGVLYGVFHLLRGLQTERSLPELFAVSRPKIKRRMLDHWDNLDRTIERGYAGFSLWDWHLLPDYISPRYADYARANASIGINATVLTNVNANALVLTGEYLAKVAALADVFRPYGIRVYLTARFSAPVEIGGLDTADPHERKVAQWWKRKAREIYALVPDFGGFLVKANSEGQPGPQDYGRSHADGANLLAEALAPHGGSVIWRAFVYDAAVSEDRAKQAYNELVPLDGSFAHNVALQVKNGPIDFQPREPFHPLFAAMPRTPLLVEFQLTQEYLGFASHLVYLAPLLKEVLDADTYATGPGSTVARVVDGSLYPHLGSGVAAVANTGTDRNWCGHPFAQANWYAFGRLAWDYALESGAIADEWIRMTFTNDDRFVQPVKSLMLESREAAVDYMTPLGLHHLMGEGHHYGPAPWHDQGRADWTSVYYHRADADGIGFDRSPTGSDAASQNRSPLRETYSSLESCPEPLLLWFHHVSWQHVLKSGRTLWDELCHRYCTGVETVRQMRRTWEELASFVDRERFEHVSALLGIHEREAAWWRDACLLHFQTFSGLPIPADCEQPSHPLQHYMSINPRHVPGSPG